MQPRVLHDGTETLRIYFPFDRRLVDVVRSLPTRSWDQVDKFWTTPDADVVRVVELLHPNGFAFCEATQRLYRERGGQLTLGDAPATLGSTVGPEQRPAHKPYQAPTAVSSDLTVRQLNAKVQATLREAFPGAIWLIAEISGYNKSAHKQVVDFELIERDDQGNIIAELRATLFTRERAGLLRRLAAVGDPFRLEDEIHVRVRGRVELYVPWGRYRFVVDNIDVNYTIGETARRRDEIRRRFIEEGIIGRNLALAMPMLPLRVGLITSIGSDAYRDVLHTFEESGLAFRVTAHGARVQGRQTDPSMLNALDWFRSHSNDFDVLLICRGGGSRTDLSWLDSEPIARAVALFPIPVVVGIGHEQDISALDFVGRRAKTPTSAAALVVGVVLLTFSEMIARGDRIVDQAHRILKLAPLKLASSANRLQRASQLAIERWAGRVDSRALQLCQVARRDISETSRRLEAVRNRLGPASLRWMSVEQERLDTRHLRLRALDPRRIVERGFAILRMDSRHIVKDARRVPEGAVLTAEVKVGVLRLRSEGVQETEG